MCQPVVFPIGLSAEYKRVNEARGMPQRLGHGQVLMRDWVAVTREGGVGWGRGDRRSAALQLGNGGLERKTEGGGTAIGGYGWGSLMSCTALFCRYSLAKGTKPHE